MSSVSGHRALGSLGQVYSGPACESSIIEVVRHVDSGLVGSYLKSVSKEEDSSSGGWVRQEGRRSRQGDLGLGQNIESSGTKCIQHRSAGQMLKHRAGGAGSRVSEVPGSSHVLISDFVSYMSQKIPCSFAEANFPAVSDKQENHTA